MNLLENLLDLITTPRDIFWIIISVIIFKINSKIFEWSFLLKRGITTEVAVGMLDKGTFIYYLFSFLISTSYIFYSSLSITIPVVIVSIFWGRMNGKKLIKQLYS